MEDAFREDLRDSREITLVQWNDRPRGQRFKEWFARLFAYWL